MSASEQAKCVFALSPMKRQPEEKLFTYLERRERELIHQLAALKGEIEAREVELAHIQSAIRQIKNLGGFDQMRLGVPEQSAATQDDVPAVSLESIRVEGRIDNALGSDSRDEISQAAHDAAMQELEGASSPSRQQLDLASAPMTESPVNVTGTIKRGGTEPNIVDVVYAIGTALKRTSRVIAEAKDRFPHYEFEELTLKQLVVKALTDHFIQGATATQLCEYINDAYGRDVDRSTLSSQLSRLSRDDVIEPVPGFSKRSGLWRLTRYPEFIEGKAE